MRVLTLILFASFLVFSSCKKHRLKRHKKQWIENAFDALSNHKYPRIKAVAWWHENFDNSKLRMDASRKSKKAYQKGVSNPVFITEPIFKNDLLTAPSSEIYHSAFPDFGGTEDEVTASKITDFEALAQKEIVWAYFSNNWYSDIQFPSSAVATIHNAGKVPFVRMMPRSNFDEGGPDPTYTMQKIIDGVFDAELTLWALDAGGLSYPILVEFGTEVNGNWFPWNGQYNGGATKTGYGDPVLADGPERFRDAYRHIIDICNTNGADNITWFFHVDAYNEPAEDWNAIDNYYPGDNYIDWLGVSVYGPQVPEEEYQDFTEIMDDVYPTITALSDKPIAILEFAITE